MESGRASKLARISSVAGTEDFWDRIGSVVDLLDSHIDPQERDESRHTHLAKLVERDTFGLCPVECFSRSSKLFPHCWVDKKKNGLVKSRFTVADVKKKYSKQALEDERSCSTPTPSEEAHACFEIYALKHGLLTRSLDIVQAFTIGVDPGDQQGNPVYVRTCQEFQPFI